MLTLKTHVGLIIAVKERWDGFFGSFWVVK